MHQFGNRLLIVGRNAVEHGLGSCIERLGHQRRGVGVANLPARRHVTRCDQFRAQRDDAHTRGSVHLHARVSGACQQTRARRSHDLAGAHHSIAGMGLLGGRANVLPYLGRRREANVRALVAIAVKHVDDLVFHYGVSTLGHRRARHDADGLARADHALKDMARCLVSDNVERHRRLTRRLRQVRRAHGISVHSAVGKRRDVDIGHRVLGQGKTGGLPHGNLDEIGRSNVRQNDRLHVLQRNEFLCHMHLFNATAHNRDADSLCLSQYNPPTRDRDLACTRKYTCRPQAAKQNGKQPTGSSRLPRFIMLALQPKRGIYGS